MVFEVMRKIPLVITLILFASGVNAMDINSLKKDIESNGAKATLADLSWPYEKWSSFVEKVKTGDKEWVEIAKRLYSVSDAGGSFELSHALAHAYSVNPESFNEPVKANEVCSPNYMELDTKPEAERYLERMRSILNGMPASEFKTECMALINKYTKWVSAWDGTTP